jgi:type I restriction enzyme R subunit
LETNAWQECIKLNDSAVKIIGDETLRMIARAIAEKVPNNATIDWTIRESARAKLMVLVKRTITKYCYPSDKQKEAIDTALKQSALMADHWVEEDL